MCASHIKYKRRVNEVFRARERRFRPNLPLAVFGIYAPVLQIGPDSTRSVEGL